MSQYLFRKKQLLVVSPLHSRGTWFGEVDKAKRIFNEVERATKIAVEELPGHRELLNKIHQYGLPLL